MLCSIGSVDGGLLFFIGVAVGSLSTGLAMIVLIAHHWKDENAD